MLSILPKDSQNFKFCRVVTHFVVTLITEDAWLVKIKLTVAAAVWGPFRPFRPFRIPDVMMLRMP